MNSKPNLGKCVALKWQDDDQICLQVCACEDKTAELSWHRADSRFASSLWGRRFFVTTFLIGWAQAYNQPCDIYMQNCDLIGSLQSQIEQQISTRFQLWQHTYINMSFVRIVPGHFKPWYCCYKINWVLIQYKDAILPAQEISFWRQDLTPILSPQWDFYY